jgi:ATP synthase assembly factor FMC1, mitochondrial
MVREAVSQAGMSDGDCPIVEQSVVNVNVDGRGVHKGALPKGEEYQRPVSMRKKLFVYQYWLLYLGVEFHCICLRRQSEDSLHVVQDRRLARQSQICLHTRCSPTVTETHSARHNPVHHLSFPYTSSPLTCVLATAMSTSAPAQTRSLYRRILRELPARTPTLTPSPIRTSIREHISSQPSSTIQTDLARQQETDQLIQYLKAQRVYTALLERYNPGMGMDEEERVRLTARRVGMDLPKEWNIGGGEKS